MTRVVLAPCSPFSVTPDLMRESAALARAYGVRLHTHLAETIEEEAFCLETFGARPVPYVESLGWTGDDVWHAHCVHMSAGEVALFGRTGTGVAHCPSSNMRLASGIAHVLELRAAGAPVGLGVDGSASNDAGHLLGEARQAMLLQRVAPDRYLSEAPGGRGGFAGRAGAMSAREALEIGTRGGAAVLGRDDLGQLAPGMSARPRGRPRLLPRAAGGLVSHQRPRRRRGRPADDHRPGAAPAPPQRHRPGHGQRPGVGQD